MFVLYWTKNVLEKRKKVKFDEIIYKMKLTNEEIDRYKTEKEE